MALNNTPVATPSSVSVASPSPVPTTQASGSKLGSSFDETAKETCGDPPDASATWYGVFVGGSLNEIRTKYCKDAIPVIRQDSGKASIQVASFSDRGRAEVFARSVNGEVSQYEPNQSGDKATATNSDSLLGRAATEYANRNYNEALKLFQQIVEDDPSNPRAWRNVGEAYHAAGDDHNATLAMNRSREIYLQNGDENGASQVAMQLEDWSSQSVSRPSINTFIAPPATHLSGSSSSGSGRCNSPDDTDIRGHRCGGRAKGMRHR